MTSENSPSRFPSDTQPKALLLLSPLYLLPLGVLVLNDFVLKRIYPGWITGKLSDLAGLFACGVFLLVCTRRTVSLFALALCFVVWKLPLSDALIRAWNSFGGWTVGRTVDPTDLIALVVLPLAWRFYRTADVGAVARKGWCVLSLLVSLIAFTATSRPASPQQMAAFDAEVAEFVFLDQRPSYHLLLTSKQLYQTLEAHFSVFSGNLASGSNDAPHVVTLYPSGPVSPHSGSGKPEIYSATFKIDDTNDGVTVRLRSLHIKKAGRRSVSQASAVRIFEYRVISPMRR